MADKYSYAIDHNDTFEGEYATREEAAAAAFADYDASSNEKAVNTDALTAFSSSACVPDF